MTRDKVLEDNVKQLAKNYQTAKNDRERSNTDNYALQVINRMVDSTTLPHIHYIGLYEAHKLNREPKIIPYKGEDEEC